MNIYHKAGIWLAEQQERRYEWGACEALVFGGGWSKTTSSIRKFDFMFHPDVYTIAFWGRQWGNDRNNCRLLALAFAAAMRDAGDL